MVRKSLKKINVTYRFKLQVLSLDENQGITLLEKTELWHIYLKVLAEVKLISYHQANTWTYPKELK